MPLATLVQGSKGSDVTKAQGLLNLRDSAFPKLKTDGIFGPKTLARVQEFQKRAGLKADGIVGPKTHGFLNPQAPLPLAEMCGNGDPGNQARVFQMQQSLTQQVTSAGRGSAGNTARITAGGVPLTPFAGSPQDTSAVRARFGASIDFSRVFMSSAQGLQNRAFTVAVKIVVPVSNLPLGVIHVMNIGTSPSESTVIHEMAHVWQSQHHSDPFQYMRACVACQGTALAQNELAALVDPALKGKTAEGFPVQFPFSAYAYVPGSAFGSYGGEQIAQQVQRNETGIVSRVQSAAPGAVDTENVQSLTHNTKTADLRLPGVKH